VIGLIVDGEAEYRSLPLLLPRLGLPSQILQPPLTIAANCNVPIGHIVRAAATRFPILASRGATAAALLIDRETNQECPGILAARITAALRPSCTPGAIRQITVVIKNSKFENWLVADVDAVTSLRRRFRLGTSAVRSIRPNKADSTDALELLKRAAIRTQYDKVTDAMRIMGIADGMLMAGNSRSFRRFLRIAGHPAYRQQSRQPA
jgi:hypothetical protein